MNIQLNLKTISIIIGIAIGSTTVITTTYQSIAWVVRTADTLVYLTDYIAGTNKKIYQIERQLNQLEGQKPDEKN